MSDIPACPSCGEHRWMFEGDITNRAAVEIIDASAVNAAPRPWPGVPTQVLPRIFIDRANPDDSTFEPGHLSCGACSFDVVPSDDPDAQATYDTLAALAKARVASRDDQAGTWRILNDYREF